MDDFFNNDDDDEDTNNDDCDDAQGENISTMMITDEDISTNMRMKMISMKTF